ncbi:MAG: PcfB family protein [Defluviitaleaceae bacterium]|nr:PcfB family protein [Defluviitaleaceae bacterium]
MAGVQETSHRKIFQICDITFRTTKELLEGMCKFLLEEAKQSNISAKLSRDIDANGKTLDVSISKDTVELFRSIARKHGISCTVKPDENAPDRYTASYASKDTAAMAVAFKEYAASVLEKQKSQDRSFNNRLRAAKEKVQVPERDATKTKRQEVDGR